MENNKKDYHSPQIKKYGSVTEITQANTFGGTFNSDGGTTGTNIYAS